MKKKTKEKRKHIFIHQWHSIYTKPNLSCFIIRFKLKKKDGQIVVTFLSKLCLLQAWQWQLTIDGIAQKHTDTARRVRHHNNIHLNIKWKSMVLEKKIQWQNEWKHYSNRASNKYIIYEWEIYSIFVYFYWKIAALAQQAILLHSISVSNSRSNRNSQTWRSNKPKIFPLNARNAIYAQPSKPHKWQLDKKKKYVQRGDWKSSNPYV